ncbi:MAG: fructosamine kinase family protein [Chlamydiia bacterium]|nr:fructosamine kinase family protein [Chlamydiia bacterium]
MRNLVVNIPEQIRSKAEEILGCQIFGIHEPILNLQRLKLYEVDSDMGKAWAQWTSDPSQKALEHSMESYRMLQSTFTFKALTPIYWGALEQGSLVLFQYVEMQPIGAENYHLFGSTLATLHKTRTPWSFGFDRDITFQGNLIRRGWARSWPEFLSHLAHTLLEDKRWQKHETIVIKARSCLTDALMRLSSMEIRPTLLHGNLKVDECFKTKDEELVLLAPRSFYGHAALDLARLKMNTSLDAYTEILKGYKQFDEDAPLTNLYQALYALPNFLESPEEWKQPLEELLYNASKWT